MWSIIVVLIIGIIIGATINMSKKMRVLNSKLQYLGVVLLLFSMGASLGLNKSLLSDLKNIGLISLVFAILTSAASIFLVYITTKYFMKGDNN